MIESPLDSPARLTRVVAILAVTPVLALVCGCFTTYSDKNRPGEVDVEQPPPAPEQPERIHPDHPGVVFFTAQAAPLLETGGTFGEPGRRRTLQAGAELAAGFGTMNEPPVGRFSRIAYPIRAHLIAFGWLPYSSQSALDTRLSAEYRTPIISDSALRLAPGWSIRPASGEHGPRATAHFLDTTYLRVDWDIGSGWSLLAGLRVPVAWTWVRSR